MNNLFLLIPLNGKRGENNYALGKKTFFKDAFLIFLLYNSSKDTFLLLLFYSPIVSSSFCFFAGRLGVDIFDKKNAKKDKRDDLKTKVQGDTDKENNLDIGIDINGET